MYKNKSNISVLLAACFSPPALLQQRPLQRSLLPLHPLPLS